MDPYPGRDIISESRGAIISETRGGIVGICSFITETSGQRESQGLLMRLGAMLQRVGPKPEARYFIFRCADALGNGLEGPALYNESIDLSVRPAR